MATKIRPIILLEQESVQLSEENLALQAFKRFTNLLKQCENDLNAYFY